MKKVTLYTALFLAILCGHFLTGCYKDVILPETAVDPDGPPQFVSYKTDLAPLFNSKCALSGCHVSGAHKPYLTTSESYIQIVNNGYVNLLIPKESIMYKKVNGEMKEYIPSAADRQKVY
ncbi:MAG: hypothetical protein ACKOU7_11260, partial [Ferruginibacter sp.]